MHVRLFTEQPGASADDDSLTTSVRSPSWDVAGYGIGDVRLGKLSLREVRGTTTYACRLPSGSTTSATTNTFRRREPARGRECRRRRWRDGVRLVGQSFRAPAILELGCADAEASCPLPFALGDDPPLKPVRATTYEVGARWARGVAQLDASLYRTEVRDEIVFIASEEALLSGYFTNIARTRRAGAELSARVALHDDRVVGYANYGFTHATFQSAAEIFSIRADAGFAASPLAGPNDVEAGDRIPLTPEHQVKGGALVRLPRGVELGADVRWIGRQWLRGDEANETRPLDAYVVGSGRLAVERREWEVALLATNLFDSHAATFGTFNENRRSGWTGAVPHAAECADVEAGGEAGDWRERAIAGGPQSDAWVSVRKLPRLETFDEVERPIASQARLRFDVESGARTLARTSWSMAA